MADWRLRRAVEDDAAALATCIDQAYAIYQSRISDLPAVSDGIADDIENHLVWVAERQGTIGAGMVLMRGDDHVLLANIAVAPANAGMGLGGRLLALAESESLRLGQTEMRLSTHVDMPENVALYEHLGWRQTGRDGNKIYMAKTLKSA